MVRSRVALACPLVALLLGCSGSGTDDRSDADNRGGYSGAELGLPPVKDGFVRYVTKPIAVEPGRDVMWDEWVAPPLDIDMDVIKVTGMQSGGGHHAILYGTTDLQPLGTVRQWQDADQLTTKTLGGVGAEGDGIDALPPGVVFRAKKGSALMIQSHFLNTTKKTLQGRSAIDVKLLPADPALKVASRFTNTTLAISLPPSAPSSLQVTCKVPKDLSFVAYANHMHSYGVSVKTELATPDGTTRPLKVDPSWNYAWAFAPNFSKFALDAPDVIPAGSTITTTCNWVNSETTTLNFPSEMCVFIGHMVEDADVTCIAGTIL